MKTHLPLVITFISLLFSATANAQYGDAYHKPNNYLIEKNQRDYGQKMRDDAKINRNTKSTIVPVTSLDDLWKANQAAIEKEKLSPEEIARRQKWEAQKKIIEEARQKRWNDDAARYNAMMAIHQPYIDLFYEAGFKDNESTDIVKSEILDNYNQEVANTEKVYNLIPLLRSAKQNIKTISYPEFNEAISALYYLAPLTSIELIQSVEKRFKDRTEELDNLKINCIIQFSNAEYYHVQFQQIPELYFSLLKKYPALGKVIVQKTGPNHPYAAIMWSLNSTGRYLDMSKGDRKKYDYYKAEYERLSKEAEGDSLEAMRTSKSAFFITQTLFKVNSKLPLDEKITLFNIATECDDDGKPKFDFYTYCVNNKYTITKELIADKNLVITYSPELLYQLSELNVEPALFLYSILICRNSNAEEREQMRSKLLQLIQTENVFMFVFEQYVSTAFYVTSLNNNQEENLKYLISTVDNMEKICGKIQKYHIYGIGNYIRDPANTQLLDAKIIAYLKTRGGQLQAKYPLN